MKILITGDSHTGPLQRGLEKMVKARPERLRGHDIHIRPLGGGHLLPLPFFRTNGNLIEITQPEFRKNFWQLPLKDHPDMEWYGVSAPLHTARVFRHEDWARHALPDTDEPGVPVSHSLLGRLVDDDQRHVQAFLLALRDQGRRPFAIEGPRPFRHHPAVEALGAGRVIAIDRFYRERMTRWLEAHDIPIVPIPARLVDADGFMIEDMRKSADDPHHGNERFGVRMLEKMLKVLEARAGGHAAAADDD